MAKSGKTKRKAKGAAPAKRKVVRRATKGAARKPARAAVARKAARKAAPKKAAARKPAVTADPTHLWRPPSARRRGRTGRDILTAAI